MRFAVGKKCSQEKKKEVSSIFSPDASHVFGRPGKSRAHMPTKPPLGFQSVCLHLPVITYSTPHDAFSTMIQRENSIIPKESGLTKNSTVPLLSVHDANATREGLVQSKMNTNQSSVA